jgi:polysaccharide chain length determinant protein (PEP-CTERM system associated)
MIGYREMSFDDYLRILKRRLKVILVPAAFGALVGYLITLFLTPEYTSTSLILIERPTVPQNLVQSVTTDDLFTRLATMQERILSRTRLQPLIERYDIYKGERKTSMEDAVDTMRKAIAVTPVQFDSSMVKSSNKQPTVPGFSISYMAENPRLVQQVCTELTSMFMEENLQQHEQLARGTTDFLSTQIAEAKQALDDQNAKLAEFKSKNLGALPDDQQANLQVLGTLNTQLSAVTDQLSRAQQDKAYLQSLLTQQEASWQAALSGNGGPDNPNPLEDQLAKMKQGLAALKGRYTDDYPDVVKLKSAIAQLEKQIADEKTSGQAAQAEPGAQAQLSDNTADAKATPPKSIQELRAQLQQVDILIRTKTKQQEQLQQQLRSYESRVQVTPVVEQQFKQLTMGHDAALKFYNDLLASRDKSQMSVDLESRGQGEQFRVLDSPNLPQDPSFPIWWEFALGGLGGGMALGIVIAGLLEVRDKAIRDERDVEFYLELPTLALVPSIGAENGRNGKPKAGRKHRKVEAEKIPA